jgi:hypothetical protein
LPHPTAVRSKSTGNPIFFAFSGASGVIDPIADETGAETGSLKIRF